MSRILFLALLIFSRVDSSATTLPPELKAYDFAEAYYIEDGGVVISPYAHGFVCAGGIETPEGIRIMPGQTFRQYDPARMVVEDYRFVRLGNEGHRAFFHEQTYRYRVVVDAKNQAHDLYGPLLGTDDFYLSRWRSLKWFDHVFTNIELQPGEQAWHVNKN